MADEPRHGPLCELAGRRLNAPRPKAAICTCGLESGVRFSGPYVILDSGSDTTTWPRPDDPEGVQWRLRYAPDQITEKDRLFAASVMCAYNSLCLHPVRTQKDSGQITGRLRRAVKQRSHDGQER